MKAPFLNRKSKGFTLIELLVVIAIILTLAGISMIVVNGVMEKSRITTARSDCNGLQTAIENYMMDNGRPPVAWTGREMSRKARKDGQYYRDHRSGRRQPHHEHSDESHGPWR